MAETKETEALDLSSFFSRDNEENGTWYEPSVKGQKVGFEVKVYGPNSKAVSVADEKFQKARDEANAIEDQVEKAKVLDKILAERFSSYIADIRGKNGRKLTINGKEVTKDDIYTIIYNSPTIALDVSRFAMKQDNFLGNKE